MLLQNHHHMDFSSKMTSSIRHNDKYTYTPSGLVVLEVVPCGLVGYCPKCLHQNWLNNIVTILTVTTNSSGIVKAFGVGWLRYSL